MIWTWIIFVLLLIILWRVAYKPIMGALEKREKVIQDSLDEAKKTNVEAESLLVSYKQQVANAQDESRKIIDEGRALGEKMKSEIISKAKEESSQIFKITREEIEREKSRVLVDLRKEVADLAIEATSKVIRQSLDRKEHIRLINEAISEVKKQDK